MNNVAGMNSFVASVFDIVRLHVLFFYILKGHSNLLRLEVRESYSFFVHIFSLGVVVS